MVRLDVERLNQETSYEVVLDSAGGLQFCTDSGVEYRVVFIPDDIIKSDESYQFSIYNLNDKPSPLDKKLQKTIAVILKEFFVCNNTTVLYICETSDGKQCLRNRLFRYWFATFPDKDDFQMLNVKIPNLDGETNYLSIIIRNDNPNLVAIMKEWAEAVQMLNSKPDGNI